MIRDELIQELAKIVGREDVFASPRDLLVYEYDSTPDIFEPEVVVFPANATEASAVMKLAKKEGMTVVPRAAGTNLSGGALALKGGIILGASRMKRVAQVDSANERVVVEPGVVNLDLQNLLGPMGYLYAPDPASQKVSTLGGNVGENSGGPHCLKYGVTTNHVYGLEAVLPNGGIIHTGGPCEDNPGYDRTGVMVASEGTMAFVTSATLRIMRLPEAIKTMLAIFDTLEDAGSAVSDIIAAGIIPATLEIMDKKVTEAVEASFHSGYPLDAEGVLIIELDGLKDGQERQAERIIELCKKNRVRDIKVAKTNDERNALWAGRKGAFGAIARISPSYSVQDGTVPRTRLSETLRKVVEIGEKYHVTIGNVAHAGDGNLHPLITFNPKDAEEVVRVHKAGKEILELCVQMGGTLTGEHGIGIEKQDSMTLIFNDAELENMARVKRAFDPDNMLNPDKILPVKRAAAALGV
ncbi:MAG: FAD-binding protein [Chloroflexi bacterium]|nr:FAD-binding protein [Chloroflexota bacterium]